MEAAGAKICVYCGSDCSDRPRVKDPAGNYACRSCATVWKQAGGRPKIALNPPASAPPASEPGGPPPPTQDKTSTAPPEPVEVPVEPPVERAKPGVPGASEPSESGIFAIAEPETDQQEPAKTPCPGCGVSMSADAVVCSRCGFDRQRGIQFGTAVDGPGPQCPGCGYSLRGLRGRTCPECGGPVPRPGSRAEKELTEARLARDFASWEYRRPALYLLVGLAGTILHGLVNANTAVLVAFPLGVLVSTLAGVAAFYAMSAFIWGFDAPFGLITLRLAGIIALSHLAWLVASFTGLPMLGWAARLLVFYALVMQEFDIDDYREVWFMTVIMQVLSVVGIWMLASLL